MLNTHTLLMLKSFATVNCHELFFFFEKREKEINNFFERLSPKLETLSIFQLSSKNTYLVEENFLCCYFFFKNFLPYKKQNLSTTFKAFSVCSPSHTFYEKKRNILALFLAQFLKILARTTLQLFTALLLFIIFLH